MAQLLGTMFRPEYLIFAMWAFWGTKKTSTLLWVAGAIGIIFLVLNEATRPIPRGFNVLELIAPFIWAVLATLWHKRKRRARKEPAIWAQTIPDAGNVARSTISQSIEKYSNVELWRTFIFGWKTNAHLLAMGIPANSLPSKVRVNLKEPLRKAGLNPIEAAVVIASRIPIASQPHDQIVRRAQNWSDQIDDTHPLVHRALRELGFQMSDESYVKAYERAGKDPEWLVNREDPVDPPGSASDE